MNKTTKIIASTLVASSLLSASPISAGALKNQEQIFYTAENGTEEGTQKNTSQQNIERQELAITKVSDKNIWSHPKVAITYKGNSLSSDARMINGEVFVSLRSFIGESTGFSYQYNSSSRRVSIKGGGFDIEVIEGGNVIYANGRTFFSMTPATIMSNGRMYAPLEVFCKILGFNYSYNGKANLTGNIRALQHGSTYYREDEVYWLSRIISAESKGESLLGQIAVGAVVMNRVKSSLYPNTIWGVIFDRKYGVQFSPVIDGSIYNTPTAVSVTAAKICLDGYNVNKSALFFLYPRNSTSSWIPNNREYLFTIGKHDFYA